MEPHLAAEAGATAQVLGLPGRSRRPPHPPTLHMVIEALQAQDQKKGVSVIAIKRFILGKYPSVDPIRLKYLLKQALSKGLSRGDLVRPHNSTAVGATGSFKLAPKKQQQKQPPSKADPDGEQAPKPGRKRTTKPPRAPPAGAQQRGAAEEKPAGAKRKPRPTPVGAQQPAKPRSNAAKPPRAASRPQAPGKGRPVSHKAPAAEDVGESDSDSPVGARSRVPRKVPAAKSKKVPKGAQPDVPKVKGGQGKPKKPRVTPGAVQGVAKRQKAAPAGKKAL
ncbi:histone H1.8 [Porphyrio hochstetteri]